MHHLSILISEGSGYDFLHQMPNGMVDECRGYATPGQLLLIYPQDTDTFMGRLTITMTTSSVIIAVHIKGYVFKDQIQDPAPFIICAIATETHGR